jgi:acetoin utilization protein AcuB
MFVEDYMTPNPFTIREDRSVDEAAAVIREKRVRQLPVVDEGGRLVGILTDRDVRQCLAYECQVGEGLEVSEVMTAEPMTISVDATLEEAVQCFVERRFGALPVMRGKELVGIISYIDALRAFTDVLGLDVAGHRVEVALPEGFADVARAFDVIRGCDGHVLSVVVSRTRRDGGEPTLYIRVEEGQSRTVEELLKKATMILLEPEHD